jgi:hypothetical protein
MFRGNFNIHLFRKQIASESMLIFFFLRCTFLTVTTETDLVRDSSAVRRLFFARAVGRHLDFCKHHLETQHLF